MMAGLRYPNFPRNNPYGIKIGSRVKPRQRLQSTVPGIVITTDAWGTVRSVDNRDGVGIVDFELPGFSIEARVQLDQIGIPK